MMEGVFTMPKPSFQNPEQEQTELNLIKELQKLENENRLDLNRHFKSIDSLDFLNDLDFKDIDGILNSLED